MNTHRRLATGFLIFSAILAASPGAATPRLSHRSGQYTLEVLVDGKALHTFRHRGESYVLGALGHRYTLRVRNQTPRRVEAVVTVDGRDVLDGKPGNFYKRGYLVPAWGSVDIEGWRLSNASVAAFRFSTVHDSYAAKTGSARNVGVIGVAIFPERRPPQPVYVPRRPINKDESYWGMGNKSADGPRRRSSASAAEPEAEAKAPSAPAADSAPQASGRRLAESQVKPKLRQHRSGLATAFGERRDSFVQEVSFERADATHPSVVLGVRYNDRRGLIAMGIDVSSWYGRYREVYVRRTASPFPNAPGRYAVPPPGWDDSAR